MHVCIYVHTHTYIYIYIHVYNAGVLLTLYISKVKLQGGINGCGQLCPDLKGARQDFIGVIRVETQKG